MEYRNLGRTGLKVSRLIFGGPHIGETVDDAKARELVNAALSVGINTFYTADKYGEGRGEEILGRAVKARRDDVVVMIKAGFRVGSAAFPVSPEEFRATQGTGEIDDDEMWRRGVAPTARGLSRKHVLKAVDDSLRRLGTDYIDVYVAHLWDPFTPIEETLGAMDTLVRQGKVRYLGCSQTASWQLYRALWASDVRGLARYESVQAQFSMLHRGAERDLLPAARAAEVSVIGSQSLAGNLLAGAYDRNSAIPSGPDRRLVHTRRDWSERTFALVDRLSTIAAEGERTVAELVQAWTLAQGGITALNVGPNEPDEFEPHVRAVSRPLTRDEASQIDSMLAA